MLFDISDDSAWPVLPESDDETEGDGHASGDTDSVVLAAQRFGRGKTAATIVSGNGRGRAGTGPLDLDWSACVLRMRESKLASERVEYARAIATMAQVVSHADVLREAGAVSACCSLLDDEDHGVRVAAAEAIRHLACGNQGNRLAAREHGAIPKLVSMLTLVADVVEAPAAVLDGCGGDCELAAQAEAMDTAAAVAMLTAATAALRNLSYQNGPNRDAIRFSGGLEPLLRIIAPGQPPTPPANDSPLREASYRAAAALENLAADNEENAVMIVRAGVVPAMKELLIGSAPGALSQKAARAAQRLTQCMHAPTRMRAVHEVIRALCVVCVWCRQGPRRSFRADGKAQGWGG